MDRATLNISWVSEQELEVHYRQSKENIPTKARSLPLVMRKDFHRWGCFSVCLLLLVLFFFCTGQSQMVQTTSSSCYIVERMHGIWVCFLNMELHISVGIFFLLVQPLKKIFFIYASEEHLTHMNTQIPSQFQLFSQQQQILRSCILWTWLP